MYPEDEQLAQRCLDLAQCARDAAAWVDDNRALVHSEAEELIKDLGKSARMFGKSAVAARRKMCVGIFGPSQAGKSYLVSSLGKDEQGSLTAAFGDQTCSFLKDINPDGGKESTGLVTRFTTSPPGSPPPGFPVQLRLLSESDIIKILANSYFEDFVHKHPVQAEAIKATLDELAPRRQPRPVGRLNADDLAEVREYLGQNFADREGVRTLERVFWPAALELAPCLEIKDRSRLFGLVWHGAAQFGELYAQLYRILEQLDFAGEACAPLSALVPKKDPASGDPMSIVDVSTWEGLKSGETARLELCSPDGQRRAEASRSLVTALIAEVTLTMASRTAPFFQHTDLLDFPGYRSRLKYKDLQEALGDPAVLRKLFVRGKVAYLFQRYCAEDELTGMLLCVGDGLQEVQSLPEVIDAWVKSTQGETAERRDQAPNSLFLVLTKMDRHFEEKEGASGSFAQRWTIRLQSSLLDYFGKGPDWPQKWNSRGPFNNVYWLRNTSIHVPGYFDYDPQAFQDGIYRELGVRPDMREHLNGLRAGFIQNEDVQRHFQDPERAWDEALKTGDGGIGYIRQRLEPICRPDIKREMIKGKVLAELSRLRAKLLPHYKSDDKEEERRKKAELGRRLSVFLATCAQHQRLGEFLACLLVRDDEFYDLYFQADSYGDGEMADDGRPTPSLDQAAPVGETVMVDDLLGELFGSPAAAPASPSPPAANAGPGAPDRQVYRDEAQRFAQAIERLWVARLHSLADDQALQRYFSPHQPWEANALVHEIIRGASRLGLWLRIENDLREAASYRNISRDKLVWKQVSRAAHALNGFISWLGLDPRVVGASQRSLQVGNNQLLVFEPPPPVTGMPKLSEAHAAFEKTYIRDWIASLLDLIMHNVDFDGSNVVDPVQNRRLGEILARLSTQGE